MTTGGGEYKCWQDVKSEVNVDDSLIKFTLCDGKLSVDGGRGTGTSAIVMCMCMRVCVRVRVWSSKVIFVRVKRGRDQCGG